MGPYKLPLVKGEDVIDINAAFKSYYPIEINKFIQFDCSKTPYPLRIKNMIQLLPAKFQNIQEFMENKKIFLMNQKE